MKIFPPLIFRGNRNINPIRFVRVTNFAACLAMPMKTLPERSQKLSSLYYNNEMTMKQIGDVLGINESRVSQIHKSALAKMAVALEANGITSSQAF